MAVVRRRRTVGGCRCCCCAARVPAGQRHRYCCAGDDGRSFPCSFFGMCVGFGWFGYISRCLVGRVCISACLLELRNAIFKFPSRIETAAFRSSQTPGRVESWAKDNHPTTRSVGQRWRFVRWMPRELRSRNGIGGGNAHTGPARPKKLNAMLMDRDTRIVFAIVCVAIGGKD